MVVSIDLSQRSFWVSLGAIAFNPIAWNIAAQAEARKHVLTKLFGGRRYTACYALAATIFLLGLNRDALYQQALRHQPVSESLQYAEVKILAAVLFAIGSTLVLTSMWQLGITGTFLGDYFGILMDAPVTSFPFNVSTHPMYDGSSLNFLATALWYGTPAGILLSAVVFVIYRIAASKYEGPFTETIYAARDRQRSRRSPRKGFEL